MTTKRTEVALPDHIKKRRAEIHAERKVLEEELIGHQNNLRKLGRTAEDRADHPETPERLARVNDVKARIATLSFEHAEHERAITLFSGGKNYMPPPG